MSHEAPDACGGSDRPEGQAEPRSHTNDGAADAASSSSSVSSTLYSAAPNNAPEAEDALELGRQCMHRGDLAAAERLVAKAVRLRPTTESMQLLASLQRQRQAQAGRGQQQAAASPVAPAAARPAPSYPPRPPAPGAAAAAAAAAAAPAAGAEAGDEPGLLFPWRRCSFPLPAFLQAPPQPGGAVVPRIVSFPYPAFIWVPPAQRRPLLLVWAAVFVLCVARLAGWMDVDEGANFSRGRRYPQRWSRPSYRSEDSSENLGSIHHDDDGTAWHNRHRSRHMHPPPSFLNLNNFLTLLPFVFFFIVPMMQRYRQQHQHQQ